MTINQAIAQSEYINQHCGDEWVDYYKKVISSLEELKDLRSKISDLNGRVEADE